MLEDRPQPTRLIETLVIEADRKKALKLVENAQHIEFQRRPRILVRYHLPLSRRLDAGADIGSAVHVHQTIRTISGKAEETARPVILEAAGEDAHTRGVKCGCHALPV